MIRAAGLGLRLAAILLAALGPAGAEGRPSLTIEPHPPAAGAIAGEMIPVTIRAVYDRKVATEDLEIAPSDSFDWLQIAPDDWHEERIGGLPWLVMERRLAVFPRHEGVLQFGPATHRLTVIDRQSLRQEVAVEARPVQISVGAFPAERGWKLAAAALTLTDELSTDPSRLRDGETVTRRVTLRAKGALPEMLPPRPVVSENWLITFAAPVERRLTLTAEGPVAEAVWLWQFRPETGEPGVLEPVSIRYYDTIDRRLESVEIPPISIGYASFAANQAATGRFGAGERAAMGAAALAGLILGGGAALRRQAPDAWARGRARFRRRWSPGPRLRLWRAARGGDLLVLRRAAADWLGRGTGEVFADLDRAIYAAPGAAPFDARDFLRRLRREGRTLA